MYNNYKKGDIKSNGEKEGLEKSKEYWKTNYALIEKRMKQIETKNKELEEEVKNIKSKYDEIIKLIVERKNDEEGAIEKAKLEKEEYLIEKVSSRK